jgi:pimeloyl-ACP methyl ester carboxylesterase
MPYFETTDGTQLYYQDWGSGRPVVLVHGWPLNADMWEYTSIALAEAGLRVITYDRRGFGRSGKPWGGYDYDTLTADLDSLIRKLDVRDLSLVGFSMGGGEVARYVARHGAERVASAVLISSVTPYLLRTEDHEDGVPATVFGEMVDGLRNDRPHFLAGFGKTFFGAGMLNFTISNELLEWASMMALQASPKATIDCVAAFSATDFRADLRAMHLPTLVIHGTADATVPIDVAGRAAIKLLPNAQLLEYPGAPHGLFYTERDRLNRDLLGFLGG